MLVAETSRAGLHPAITGNEPSGAQLFARAFARHGITVAFGQSIPSLFHLVAPSHGISQAVYRTENAGGAMADAYARVTNRVALVTAQNGPAATLLVAPLAEALKVSVPVIALEYEHPETAAAVLPGKLLRATTILAWAVCALTWILIVSVDVETVVVQMPGHARAQSVAYALTALACALVALLALGAGVARHLHDYRLDVASLRVLGISTGTARRAGRAELVSLTVLVLVGVVAGGWLAVRLLLDGLPLLSLPVAGLPLDTAPHLVPLVVPAVLAAAAVVLVGGRARAVRAATTRPSLLRDEEGR